MFGLSPLDLFVIAAYFIGLMIIGVMTYRSVKSTGDYFMGNRRFGKLLMIGHALGAGTHTDQPVAVAGACSQIGLAGIWYQWLWMFATPFYWLIAPIYRRLRYITLGDFFENRYGRNLGAVYAVMGLMFFALNTGIMLKGTGTTIDAITLGALPTDVVVIIMTILFVLYSVLGGLVAAVITDLIQGLFILILSFLMIPFAIKAAGGLAVIHQGLPEHMFSFVAPKEVTLFFITMVIVNGLVGIVVQPHHMAVGGSGKTEMSCRTGWTYGNLLKRIATLGWAFIGVFAAFLYPSLTEANREMAFGMAVMNLLPQGLIGLMIASMAAAVMSTCDAFMVGGSALFTRNFYRKYHKKNASEQHYLLVARLSAVVVVIGGVLFGLFIPNVVAGLKIMWKFTAFFGIGFWMAVIWRRANRYGVYASLIVSFGTMLYTGDYFSWSLNWSLPAQIAVYLPAGFVAFVVTSVLTKPEPEAALDSFYTLLRTPVGEEHKLKDAGVEIILEGESVAKDKNADSLLERGHSLILVDLLKLKQRFSFKRYKIDTLGFGFAVLLVLVILFLGFFAAGIGA